jgi:hypothetical protein
MISKDLNTLKQIVKTTLVDYGTSGTTISNMIQDVINTIYTTPQYICMQTKQNAIQNINAGVVSGTTLQIIASGGTIS